MGVFNKFKDLMGFEEYEDEEELEEEEEYEKNNSYYDRKPVEPRTQATTSPRYDSGNVVSMPESYSKGDHDSIQAGGDRTERI